METREHTEGDWTVLGITGRVDSHTAPELDAAFRKILDQGAVRLILDMSDIQYLSSAGLRVLLATLKQVRSSSGDLQLRSPKGDVKAVLVLSGFSDLFTVIDTESL